MIPRGARTMASAQDDCARWCCRLPVRTGNDGLTHSYNKLTAMLQDAGFRDLQSFWATPEMRCPAAFIPTDPESVRAARRTGSLVQGDTRSTRLLMPFVPALWVKQVMPGLTFLAKKI